MSYSVRPYLLTTSASNDSPGSFSRAPEHQGNRHGQQDAWPQRPLVEAVEHPCPALAGDFNRVLLQDVANELCHARILGVKSMRADVEMKIAVVKRSAEAADHFISLDDGDLVSLSRQLVADRQPGDAGADDGDCAGRLVHE